MDIEPPNSEAVLIAGPAPRRKRETALHYGKIVSHFVGLQILMQIASMLSGLILVRRLSKEEYAFYTIAGAAQSTINIMSSCGVDSGLLAIGGKVWNDPHRMGQLLATALQFRRKIGLVTFCIVVPALTVLLITNHCPLPYAILLGVIAVLGSLPLFTRGVIGVAPRLRGRGALVQGLELTGVAAKLALLLASVLVYCNAFVAMLANSFGYWVESQLLKRSVARDVDFKSETNLEDAAELRRLFWAQFPSVLYYCLESQITVWMLTFFSTTSHVADLGALSRFGAIFSMAGAFLGIVVFPSFAKRQRGSDVLSAYLVTTLAYAGFSLLLFASAYALPGVFIWVLGKHYNNLTGAQLCLYFLASGFINFVGCVGQLNRTRGWIMYSWLSVPATILFQIVLLYRLDLSTLEGALWFGMLSPVPLLATNIFLAIVSFRSLFRTEKLVISPSV